MPASSLPTPCHQVCSILQNLPPSHGHGSRVSRSLRLPDTHSLPLPCLSLDQATRENATQKLEQASRENYVRRLSSLIPPPLLPSLFFWLFFVSLTSRCLLTARVHAYARF